MQALMRRMQWQASLSLVPAQVAARISAHNIYVRKCVQTQCYLHNTAALTVSVSCSWSNCGTNPVMWEMLQAVAAPCAVPAAVSSTSALKLSAAELHSTRTSPTMWLSGTRPASALQSVVLPVAGRQAGRHGSQSCRWACQSAIRKQYRAVRSRDSL